MTSEKLISCCGLDCSKCEAYLAHKNNDDTLRAETAEKWKTMYNADITPDMINCTGCREPGIKLAHCPQCEIRKCAFGKEFQTCGECDQLETCAIVKNVHQFAPEALENLKHLN